MMRRQVVLLLNEWAMAAISSYDERISMFLHALVPECNLRAVIFYWLPWVGGLAQTNLLKEWVTATEDSRNFHVLFVVVLADRDSE